MFNQLKQRFHTTGKEGRFSLSMTGDSFTYFLIALFVLLGPVAFIPVRGFSVGAAKGFLFLFVVIIGFLAVAVHALRKGSVTIPRHTIFWMLGLMITVGFLGAIFSPAFFPSLIGYGFETTTWLFTVLFGIVAFLTYRTVRSYERIGMLFGALLGGFVMLAIIHILRYAFGPTFLNLGAMFSNTATLIGSWGDLAIFFGLIAIFSAITLELAGLKKTIRIVIAAIGITALVFLAFMNIRIVWIVLGLVSLLFSLYLFSLAYWDREAGEYNKDSRVPWWVMGIFIISIICIFFGPVFNSIANRHRTIMSNDIRPSVGATMQVVWKSIKHNPATGYGPNMFSPAWSLTKPVELSGNNLSNVDFSQGFGYVPTQMATSGVLGMITWVALFLVLAWSMMKSLVGGFEYSVERYCTVLLAAAITYLGVIAWVYLPGTYILGILAILVGTWFALQLMRGKTYDTQFSFIKDPRASFFGILAITIIIVGTIFAGYMSVRKFTSFTQYARGMVKGTQNDIVGASQALSSAAVLASYDIYHRELSKLSMIQVNQLLAKVTSANRDALSTQANQLLGSALGHAQAAVAANPSNWRNWALQGDVYRFMLTLGVADAADRANESYGEAERRNPNDATMKLYYAQLALAKKDTAGALSIIADSIKQRPTRDAYIIRAQIEMSQQKTDQAIESLKQGVIIDPYNASLTYQYGLMLFSAKRYTDASAAFQRTILLDRTAGPAYVYLGVSYERAGNSTDAQKVYDFVRKQFTDGDAAITQVKNGIIEQPAPQAPDQSPVPPNAPAKTQTTVEPKTQ